MGKGMLETAQLRKALEQEIRETDFAVTSMEEGLSETERQCGLHHIPLQQITSGMEMRNKRMGGEKIRDTVAVAKEDVLNVINTNIKALQEQYKRKKTVLEQMTTMRQQLHEDLRYKIQAIAIDTQCSKLLTRPHSARLGCPSPPLQAVGKQPFRRKGPGQNNSRTP